MNTGLLASPLDVVVIGGGAAGFFAAIAAAEAAPSLRVTLFEASPQLLAKVRISGGGRCNVTHACFDPRELVRRYPRGGRELLGPLHRFGPTQTVAWFQGRGVTLKTESDGRMFPITDNSETIVQLLLSEARRHHVEVKLRTGVRELQRMPLTKGAESADGFRLVLTDGTSAECRRVILATGGARSGSGAALAASLGHTIEPPVPSLFTFHIEDARLRGLEGLSVPNGQASVPGTKLREAGPVLVTHWGLSGPAILKLSAWGARELDARQYRFPLQIGWVAELTPERALADLMALRQASPRRHLGNANPWELPARLWERLVGAAGLAPAAAWTTVSNAALNALARHVAASEFAVTGKSLNKDEFVTCGGVRLREVDFRTMESRCCPNLFFAGEVLDVDGVTGGFNFQAAWTTGWIAGQTAAAGLCGTAAPPPK